MNIIKHIIDGNMQRHLKNSHWEGNIIFQILVHRHFSILVLNNYINFDYSNMFRDKIKGWGEEQKKAI